MMKLGQKIRKIWHDVFYKNASEKRVEFALKCQDVTADIDIHNRPNTFSGRFRYYLHLSLCQACKNYYDVSKFLSSAAKKPTEESAHRLNSMNESLLKKYGQNNDKK